MLAIVRFFLQVMAVSCLAILPVYATEASNITFDMPLLVIDLSPIASAVFLQQAQWWFFLLAVGVFVCFVVTLLMSRPLKQQAGNQGDILANQVFKWWLVFLLILIMGFALPLLRIWMVMG